MQRRSWSAGSGRAVAEPDSCQSPAKVGAAADDAEVVSSPTMIGINWSRTDVQGSPTLIGVNSLDVREPHGAESAQLVSSCPLQRLHAVARGFYICVWWLALLAIPKPVFSRWRQFLKECSCAFPLLARRGLRESGAPCIGCDLLYRFVQGGNKAPGL